MHRYENVKMNDENMNMYIHSPVQVMGLFLGETALLIIWLFYFYSFLLDTFLQPNNYSLGQIEF